MSAQKLDWLAYAVTGKEFIAMDDLTRFGIDHWRGVRVEFERRGKARTADPYEYPALHNYIWIRPTPSQVAKLSEVRFLGSTFHMMGRAAIRGFDLFRGEVEERHAEAMRIVGNRSAIAEYKRGDPIQVRDGVLAGFMATFHRMVKRQHDLFPVIEAEMELFGRSSVIHLDPLDVRRASSG